MTNDTGFVPWLTGLSEAGKSTVAAKLAPALAERDSVHQVLAWLETNQLTGPTNP